MLGIQEKEKLELMKIKKVKDVAKAKRWNTFLGGDKFNFHIVTTEGMRLGREEWHNATKSFESWFMWTKQGKKVYGTFDEITARFIMELNAYRENVICL